MAEPTEASTHFEQPRFSCLVGKGVEQGVVNRLQCPYIGWVQRTGHDPGLLFGVAPSRRYRLGTSRLGLRGMNLPSAPHPHCLR